MNIEGKVKDINEKARVAVVDIGWGEAVVVEFETIGDLVEGDILRGLQRSYCVVDCLNISQCTQIQITVLSGSLPMQTARYIVTSELNAIAVA